MPLERRDAGDRTAKNQRVHVVRPFVADYLAGRTPIPCVACNDRLKFSELVRRAKALGARRVVTGHHARTRHQTPTPLREIDYMP